ncbi:imidazoleglycerol-phosphate dehydratase HisB [archaeon]|nr:MAG: imidazoleglycerol-phosphate dehydratase HisB [archaeon]
MRTATVNRTTKETRIKLTLSIDGTGASQVATGIGFLDHMLESFARHGAFDITLSAEGDLEVDQHHLVEDVGIALGKAFDAALDDRRGINRTGYFVFPMDESLAVVAVDISGRPTLQYDAPFTRRYIGELDADLLYDLFKGFADNLRATVAVRAIQGRNDHHKAEAIFKAFGKAMRMACSHDSRMIEDIPSTKGVIE